MSWNIVVVAVVVVPSVSMRVSGISACLSVCLSLLADHDDEKQLMMKILFILCSRSSKPARNRRNTGKFKEKHKQRLVQSLSFSLSLLFMIVFFFCFFSAILAAATKQREKSKKKKRYLDDQPLFAPLKSIFAYQLQISSGPSQCPGDFSGSDGRTKDSSATSVDPIDGRLIVYYLLFFLFPRQTMGRG